MLAVTVSPKFQVVIPQAIREQLRIVAGQKVQVLAIGRRIELMPIESPKKLRGFLGAVSTPQSSGTTTGHEPGWLLRMAGIFFRGP